MIFNSYEKGLFLKTVFILCFGILASCSDISKRNLAGTWKAVAILEEKDSLEIDLSEVRLVIDRNNRYSYTGNLKQKEAGLYRLEAPYLFTTDTIAEDANDKAVEIIKLTDDSLHIRMMEEERERILMLVRE